MIEILPEMKPSLISLFEETAWELSGFAVLAGHCPGRLWVDNAENPAIGFMHTPEGSLLTGNPDNQEALENFRLWFDQEFLPHGIRNEAFGFDCYFAPKWYAPAGWLFESRPLIQTPRLHFLVQPENVPKNLPEPSPEFQQIWIDPAFIRSGFNLKNKPHIRDWVKNNWGTDENFSRNGFGFCLKKDDVIISWSVCDCVFEDRCEIGIHTDPDFRRRGLAAATTRHMLQYAFAHGFREVGWHCDADNAGSIGTATRNGFIKERDYFSWSGYFNLQRHQLMTAFSAIETGDADNARTILLEVLDSDPVDMGILYDLACGFARIHMPDHAFPLLRVLIGNDPKVRHPIQRDPDFDSLRELSEWKELMG